MGTAAGYGAEDHKYIGVGYTVDLDPNAAQGRPFSIEVGPEGYSERWTQELQVFHNPDAVRPLSEDALPMATHHRLVDGHFVSEGEAAPELTGQDLPLP